MVEIQDKEKDDDFIYIHNGKRVMFRILENGKFQCPYCETLFTTILKHLINKNCNISQSNIDAKEFKSQLDSFKEGYRLELGREKKLEKAKPTNGRKGC